MADTQFSRAAKACFENGERLLEDAQNLSDYERYSSAFAFAVLAQEECAKSFLLHLVAEGVIPWTPLIWRATRDHATKHLLSIILDRGISPDPDEYGKWLNSLPPGVSPDEVFPADVASALDIFRHEKVGRWESQNWCWDEEPKYDREVKKVGEGGLDREKQDALFVRISKTGEIASRPERMTPDMVSSALERANDLKWVIKDILTGGDSFLYERVKAQLKALFSENGS